MPSARTFTVNFPKDALQQIASSLPSPAGRGAGGEGNTPAAKGRLGVFWHTQGSGKSVSMICFAQKVLRRIPGNWTFVIIADRQELDAQIYKNFAAAGAVTEKEAQATSSRHLRQLLTEDHRYVFTLIHKFRTERGEEHPMLSERSDIIVITDGAHRSQYDTLALNMRTALPNASFIAFTGTPLIVGEEKTREVFGDYVSVYDFRQSVIDFEALQEKFAQGRRRTEAEKLKGQVDSKLKQMLRLNHSRMDYLERFQKMIDEYNAGNLNIDELFQRLMAFAEGLNEEKKRGVAEQLSEEELALFDILTKPRMALSDTETKQVKKAARDLLDALKRGKLVLDWRKFQQSRAAVKIGIEDVLDEGLPESFTPELFQQKVEAVYRHVFDSYYGGGRGIYAAAP